VGLLGGLKWRQHDLELDNIRSASGQGWRRNADDVGLINHHICHDGAARGSCFRRI